MSLGKRLGALATQSANLVAKERRKKIHAEKKLIWEKFQIKICHDSDGMLCGAVVFCSDFGKYLWVGDNLL